MGTRELPVSHLRNSFNGEQPTNYMSLHPVEDVGVRATPTRRFGQASLGRPGINAAGALRGSLCGVGKKRDRECYRRAYAGWAQGLHALTGRRNFRPAHPSRWGLL